LDADITPSTGAAPMPSKFVAGCGVQPLENGRESNREILAAVGVAASRSVFGSEKIETLLAPASPS